MSVFCRLSPCTFPFIPMSMPQYMNQIHCFHLFPSCLLVHTQFEAFCWSPRTLPIDSGQETSIHSIIEFREPWFLEGNKWWNMPWSRKVLQTTSEQKHTNTQGSNHRGFMGDCIPTCTNDTKSALFESVFKGGQYSEVFTPARAHGPMGKGNESVATG